MSAYISHDVQLSELGEAALEYARNGWPIFPLSREKKPILKAPSKGRGGFHQATCDESQILRWWTKYPNANIGLATGAASGWLVIDIDGLEGAALLRELVARHGLLPKPAIVITGRDGGGRHLYFMLPPGCGRVKSSASDGLDIKADGGYTMLPPSLHQSGRRYQWGPDGPPRAPTAAPASAWLIAFARNRNSGGSKANDPRPGRVKEAASSRSLVGTLQGNPAAPDPHSEAAETRLRNALAMVDASDRDTWLRFGMALHELTRVDPAWAVPARRLWDEWSATCHEKFSAEGQDKAWASFGRDFDRRRVTVGTIFGSAKEAGWVDSANAIAVRLATAPGTLASDGSLVITVAGGEIASNVDEAEAAIIRSGHPLFVRAGALVRPISELMPAAKGRTTIVAKLCEMTTDSIIDLLARSARFEKYDARSGRMVRTDPPEKVAKVLLSREGSWNFPRISGVITTPTIRPDGSILAEPGYDLSTRLYLMPDTGLTLPPQPDTPTRKDALAAIDVFSTLLCGFPSVGDVDRAVALSGIITAVVRGAIDVAPLHVIRAHTAGTGKSHLVDVAAAIATGRRCPVIAFAQKSDENEKRLGALLREGVPIVSLDNVNGEIGGDALCQMTERPLVRIRVLGLSETPEFECRATIFCTGNNTTVSGDMVRRAIICNLDAGMEEPERRIFKFDPLVRVLEDRGHYIAAVLTIVRAYILAGSPAVCGPIGSYGQWSGLVRAPLVWLGEADPVLSMEASRQEDPELTSIRELFGQWIEHVTPNEYYTTSRIIQLACEQNGLSSFKRAEFRELLLRMAGAGGSVSSKSLGRWLTRINGRICEGHKLLMAVDGKHGNRYALVRV